MSYQDWRRALQEVVDAGLREHRAAQVIAALGAEIGKAEKQATRAVTAGPPTPAVTEPDLDVRAPVLGVDGCRGGWVGVLLTPDLPPRVLTAETITGLAELAREQEPVEVIAIDIPIGLPDTGRREADAQARKALPGKGSSVFTTLTRAAWAAGSRGEADVISRETSGRGVPPYTYALRTKVLEVDDWLRTRPPVRVVEVHPELSFAEMAGAPLLTRKSQPAGATARREALAAAGLVAPPFYPGSGFREDDLLDACAAAWSAVRVHLGAARSLPETPEVFSDGIHAAIWV